MIIDDLKRSAADLVIKYPFDLNSDEFSMEIESFKFQSNLILDNFIEMGPLQILNGILWSDSWKYSSKSTNGVENIFEFASDNCYLWMFLQQTENYKVVSSFLPGTRAIIK